MKKHISPIRFILSALVLLIALIILAYIVLMLIIPAFERVDQTEVPGSADWMKKLPDDIPIADIILPGAHDCATAGVQLAYFSRCQQLSVRRQLDAGYRYLDIRLGADGDRLRLMHGFTGCTKSLLPWSAPLYLEDVLADCYEFLDAHPTETILFTVKYEHGDISSTAFSELFLKQIADDADRWLITDRLPELSEARGKLVLFWRYSVQPKTNSPAGLPLFWSDQKNRDETSLHGVLQDNGMYTIWVQDRYKYEANDKYTAFVTALDEAEDGNLNIFFLSTNGDHTFGHPAKYAIALNPRLLADATRLYGWVITDFASPALAQRIYRENFN